MRLTLAFGLACLAVGVCSCTRPLSDVGPEPSAAGGKDLELVYEHGATHAERGRTRLTIGRDGAAQIVESGPRVGGAVTNLFALSAEEQDRIARALEANRFFSLRASYDDPRINDGHSAFIRARLGGREHTVTVVNARVDAFNAVARVLDEIAAGRAVPVASQPKEGAAW